jgi:peroxiredoxin
MVDRSRRRLTVCLLALAGVLGTGSARTDVPGSSAKLRIAADFELRDVTSNRTIKLSDYVAPGSNGSALVVLAFTGVGCPIGDLYMPRLVELARAYQGKGVTFLAINSNAYDSALQVAEHARRFNVPFPVLKDPGNVVADQNRVERTSEVFVIGRMRKVHYHGAIDDQYGIGTRKDARRVATWPMHSTPSSQGEASRRRRRQRAAVCLTGSTRAQPRASSSESGPPPRSLPRPTTTLSRELRARSARSTTPPSPRSCTRSVSRAIDLARSGRFPS